MTTVAAGQTPGAEQSAGPITEYQRTYPGWADQVHHVRRDVAGQLGEFECPVTDDALVVLSEFASNAILHSRSRGGCFTIRVALYRNSVKLACQDAGGVWRGRHSRHQDDDRPHGLSIVEALAGPAAWGVEVTSDGRIVWATLTW
jgi:anti-sigma regulatory factor (Ser/Thr protein kinase)